MKQEKIKHIWSVLCSSSITDQESNNVTLSIIEAIQGVIKYDPESEGFKKNGLVIPINLEVVTLLQKIADSKVKISLQVMIIGPDGTDLGIMKQVANIPKDKRRMRIITRMQALKIKGNGDYLFKVLIREQSSAQFTEVAEIPLEVNVKVQKSPIK